MNRLLLACTLLFYNVSQLYSCVNEYRALLDGRVVYTDAINASPHPKYSENDQWEFLKELENLKVLYRDSGKIEDLSDWGAVLIYLGKYKEAKDIFFKVENISPGRYQTASNLGTVYELLGMNDSALFWIKRSVHIFPGSHHGSEWIHVKILEAKIKASEDKNYWSTHSILNFGNSGKPENDNKYNIYELNRQLREQISERMTFVKPKDPVLAQLLFDLGNTEAWISDVTGALQIFETAEIYGYDSELFRTRKRYFKRIQFKADIFNHLGDTYNYKKGRFILYIIVFVSVFFVMPFILIRRYRKRKKLEKVMDSKK